jgi:chorismate synthase
MKTKFRPSHADFTYFAKYGVRNWQGGGRASARETVGRVAAGAIAKKILRERFGVETLAYVKQVQRLVADVNPDKVKFKDIESNIVRCPDGTAAEKMIRLIEKMRRMGDTVGGIVEGLARGVPAGWGEPVFDKLEADLAKAMLSLPASKAFEIGSGFSGITLTGREHNDPFRAKQGQAYPTGRRFSFASRSNPWPPSCTSRTRWMNNFTIRRSRAAVAMTRACCRARCRWWKR